ncbi:MAG: recombinase family protein [Oscillospiraceae bacterium]|jgi:site-specific DNA recombinase|nr:recombinase family protein [Oscillospiraceae bacterium]
METAIYIRVSTEEQAQEGFSIRAQEQKLKDFAQIKDWTIFNIYMDEGLSGKNIKDRPAINRMIEDIRGGLVKNVLVYKIDRLTRSTSDLIHFMDLFNQHDCAFNSLMESIDTQTASGRMFLKIIGIFAEFERENIIERVKLGRERKVKEGYTLCSSHASYGYDRASGQKIQSVNEEEARVVKEIFDMFVNRSMSINSITKTLNMRKVPTKKNAAMWCRKNVRNILKNCNYIGKVRHFVDDDENYSENEGLHEPIIPEELFNEAGQLLKRASIIAPTKKPREENYFLGVLICGLCQKKLTTHNRYITLKDGTKNYHGSYRCIDKFVGCPSGEIKHNKIEVVFNDYISRISNFVVGGDIEFERQEKSDINRLKSIESYNKRLNKLSAKENEILSLYVENELDFNAYKSMNQKINKDREFINTELEKLKMPEEADLLLKKEDIILSLKENWNLLTDIEKRQFLMKFINKITVTSEKSKNTRRNTVNIETVEFNLKCN